MGSTSWSECPGGSHCTPAPTPHCAWLGHPDAAWPWHPNSSQSFGKSPAFSPKPSPSAMPITCTMPTALQGRESTQEQPPADTPMTMWPLGPWQLGQHCLPGDAERSPAPHPSATAGTARPAPAHRAPPALPPAQPRSPHTHRDRACHHCQLPQGHCRDSPTPWPAPSPVGGQGPSLPSTRNRCQSLF